MNVPARRATAAITRPTGLASMTAFNAAMPVRTSLTAATIFGARVMSVPTPAAIFPMMISTGPMAATIPIRVSTILCAAGFMFMIAFMMEMS